MCRSESHSDSDFKQDVQEAVASGVDVAQLLAQLQAAKAQEAVGMDPEVLSSVAIQAASASGQVHHRSSCVCINLAYPGQFCSLKGMNI